MNTAKRAAPDAINAARIADPLVSAALKLGWHMAEFYSDIRPAELRPPTLPKGKPAPAPAIPPRVLTRIQLQADLPGTGALSETERRKSLIDEIQAGFRAIEGIISATGLDVPALPPLGDLVRISGAEGRYQTAAATLTFHVQLLVRLRAGDARLGKAYALGRALADLTLRPRAGDTTTFVKDFRQGRVVGLMEDLRDLKSSLPPHAAEAVVTSMGIWQAWAAAPMWDGLALDWTQHGKEVVRVLQDQGKQWRLLLTGEKEPLDVLTAENYVDASGFLLGRLRQLLERFAGQYWLPLTTLGVFVIAGVVGALVARTSEKSRMRGKMGHVHLNLPNRSYRGRTNRTPGPLSNAHAAS